MDTSAIKRIAIIMVIATGITLSASAQQRNDVIKAFNAGARLVKTDLVAAIDSFERSISIAEQVGESAEDLRQKAIGYLPGLYYQHAYNLLSEGNDLQGAIQATKKTREVAEKYSNASIADNANKLLVQEYTSMASGYYTNKENDMAIAAFDSVLMIDPGHISSLYNKALIYRGMGDTKDFSNAVDAYIEQLNATGDSARLNQAKEIAIDYYRVEAVKQNQAENLDSALNLLNAADKYGQNKEINYLYANIYNKQKKYSMAAENARAGLELENGTAEEKAKFWFELGEAQAGMGDTSGACTSYTNANYGAFSEAAKAQKTNLKCP